MKRASAIALLAVAWLLLSGELTLVNLLAGVAVAFVALFVVRFPRERGLPRLRMSRVLAFVFWFTWQVVKANVRIALEVLRRNPKRDAAVVRVPMPPRPLWEVTVLANLVTFVPGTLVIEVSDEPRELYVHGLFDEDPEEIRQDVERLARHLERMRR